MLTLRTIQTDRRHHVTGPLSYGRQFNRSRDDPNQRPSIATTGKEPPIAPGSQGYASRDEDFPPLHNQSGSRCVNRRGWEKTGQDNPVSPLHPFQVQALSLSIAQAIVQFYSN